MMGPRFAVWREGNPTREDGVDSQAAAFMKDSLCKNEKNGILTSNYRGRPPRYTKEMFTPIIRF